MDLVREAIWTSFVQYFKLTTTVRKNRLVSLFRERSRQTSLPPKTTENHRNMLKTKQEQSERVLVTEKLKDTYIPYACPRPFRSHQMYRYFGPYFSRP